MIIPFSPKFIMLACKNNPSLLNLGKVKIKLEQLNADDAQIEMYESNGAIAFRALNGTVDSDAALHFPENVLHEWLSKLGATMPQDKKFYLPPEADSSTERVTNQSAVTSLAVEYYKGTPSAKVHPFIRHPDGRKHAVKKHRYSFQMHKATDHFEMTLDNKHTFELQDTIFKVLNFNSYRIMPQTADYLFLTIPLLVDRNRVQGFADHIAHQDDETIKNALRMVQACYAGDQWKNDRQHILKTISQYREARGYPIGKTPMTAYGVAIATFWSLIGVATVTAIVLTIATLNPLIILSLAGLLLIGSPFLSKKIDSYFKKRNGFKTINDFLIELDKESSSVNKINNALNNDGKLTIDKTDSSETALARNNSTNNASLEGVSIYAQKNAEQRPEAEAKSDTPSARK